MRLENDLFFESDRNYTSGISLTATSRDTRGPYPITRGCLPALFRPHFILGGEWLPFLLPEPGREASAENVVLKLGQAMYTPADPRREDLAAQDRPYAGWLYLGLTINRRYDRWKGSDEDMLEARDVNLGLVGPVSLARQTQDLIHDLRGFERFRGWRNQLRSEPGVQVTYERKYRPSRGSSAFGGLEFDTVRYWGLTAGNVETSATLGAELRYGSSIPRDFGSFPIRPAAESRAPGRGTQPPGWHLFGAVEAKGVLRDIFLDGNTFRDSHRVDKEPLVLQFATGVSFYRGPVRISLMRVVRSREFRLQEGRHTFGSIAVTVDF